MNPLSTLSEADVKAAEVLDELRNNPRTYVQSNDKDKHSSSSHGDEASERLARKNSDVAPNLINRVVNNVVTLYDDLSNRKKVASIARLIDDAYEENYTTTDDEDDSESESESESEGEDENNHKSVGEIEAITETPDNSVTQKPEINKTRPTSKLNISILTEPVDSTAPFSLSANSKRVLQTVEGRKSDHRDGDDKTDDEYDIDRKKQKLSNAIKEYQTSMSQESQKKLVACLHLLNLANKQLSERISSLQEFVEKEQQLNDKIHKQHQKQNSKKIDKPTLKAGSSQNREDTPETDAAKNGNVSEEEDRFFDAFDSTEDGEQATVIKMEIVGTIKKIYSVISRFTGNALPEPARSKVRESLLNLPNDWSSSVSNFHDTKNVNEQKISNHNTGNKNMDNGGSIQIDNIKGTRTNDTKNKNQDNDNDYITTNGKVLILAKESLNMVQNVTDVVDSTLGKTEEWAKEKEELKQMLYKRFRQTKVKYESKP